MTRPRFWPQQRWAQVALVLLLVLTLFRGALWASSVPPWWAPDEDYHWGYVNYLDEKGSIPDPAKPFYAPEWNKAIVLMDYNQYGQHPAPNLRGDPHLLTRQTAGFSAADRQPTGAPTRPVLHVPLYHAVAAAVVKPFAGESVFTRLWIARMVSGLFGVLAVYFAWVLAFELLRRSAEALFAGGIVAMQPMIAFASGTATNDAAITAFFTAVLAMACFVARAGPDRRQGWWLGGALALALLSKSTALLLIPLVIVALLVQWRLHRGLAAELRRTVLRAAAVPLAVSSWFYLMMMIKYGSVTGSLSDITATTGDLPRLGLTSLRTLIPDWVNNVYSTYWAHYLYFEAVKSQPYGVPAAAGSIGIFGLALWSLRERARMFKPDWHLGRQAGLLLAAALILPLPFFLADMARGLEQLGFAFNGGRFIIPAFPAVAVLFVIGIKELTRPVYQRAVFAALAVVAGIHSLWVWKVQILDRYSGPKAFPFDVQMHRASFFKPEFITGKSMTVMLATWLLLGAICIGLAVFQPRLGGTASPELAAAE